MGFKAQADHSPVSSGYRPIDGPMDGPTNGWMDKHTDAIDTSGIDDFQQILQLLLKHYGPMDGPKDRQMGGPTDGLP